MGNRKQMNQSWLNIEWFKRKALHEYQSGGKENALKYVEHLSKAISDSDYVELLQYIKKLKQFVFEEFNIHLNDTNINNIKEIPFTRLSKMFKEELKK